MDSWDQVETHSGIAQLISKVRQQTLFATVQLASKLGKSLET